MMRWRYIEPLQAWQYGAWMKSGGWVATFSIPLNLISDADNEVVSEFLIQNDLPPIPYVKEL